jgi:hypothetical protein
MSLSTESAGVSVRSMGDALAVADALVVVELIAYVLGRAHRMAEAHHAPTAARAILYVADSFADDLESAVPRFDRMQFIQAVTAHPTLDSSRPR